MADLSSYLTSSQFLCKSCLDFFKKPSGHNFQNCRFPPSCLTPTPWMPPEARSILCSITFSHSFFLPCLLSFAWGCGIYTWNWSTFQSCINHEVSSLNWEISPSGIRQGQSPVFQGHCLPDNPKSPTYPSFSDHWCLQKMPVIRQSSWKF
jgi:hypothetical protein